MRALLSSLLFSAAAMDASAHPLGGGHSPAEELAHAFTAPHHALLFLAAIGIALAACRILGARPAAAKKRR